MPEKATQSLAEALEQRIAGSAKAVASLRDQLPDIAAMCEALANVADTGGTIYTAGNGGSAAQALHLAEELVGRYRSNREPHRAMCLCADPTALTCIANDFGFEEVFARQARAFLTSHDALVVFTTSGNSANIVRALQVAREAEALTVGLLGGDGGACKNLCHHFVTIASSDSAHVQDAHQVLLHLICERLESARPARDV